MTVEVAEPGAVLGGRIEVGAEINRDFGSSERGTRITTRRTRLISPGSSVFTIGSCFAENIRKALNENGFDAGPRFETLDIDLEQQMAGPWRHINYYTTFSIRQELQRVLEGLPSGPPHLPVASGAWKVGLQGGWEARWQDPLRHGCVATTEDGMLDVMAKIDTLYREGLESADAFILTLGLIETWLDSVTGMYVWSSKVRSVSTEPERFSFHLSTYEENLDNIRWICRTLHERFPGKPIVISVSPVALLNTFTAWDVVTANTYSKSMLHAVAGAIDLEFPDVTYWPSYELCTHADIYKPDGRHVTDAAVRHVVGRFLEAHAAVEVA